jgi:hypothetical protein
MRAALGLIGVALLCGLFYAVGAAILGAPFWLVLAVFVIVSALAVFGLCVMAAPGIRR